MNINQTTKSTGKRFDEQLNVDCIILIDSHDNHFQTKGNAPHIYRKQNDWPAWPNLLII